MTQTTKKTDPTLLNSMIQTAPVLKINYHGYQRDFDVFLKNNWEIEIVSKHLGGQKTGIGPLKFDLWGTKTAPTQW